MTNKKGIGVFIAIIGVVLIIVSKSLPEVRSDSEDAKRRGVFMYPGIVALLIGAGLFALSKEKKEK